MSIPIDWKRSEINTEEIKTGLPVASREWSRLIGLSNYLHAKGAQLIPACCPMAVVEAAATSTFHFSIAPKFEVVERVWCIVVRAPQGGPVTVDITIGGVTYTRGFSTSPRQTVPIEIRQPLTFRVGMPEKVSVAIKNRSPGDKSSIIVETISMYEQNRGALAPDTSDHGVAVASGYPLAPVIDLGVSGFRSVGGVTRAYQDLDMRRAGHFHWSPGIGNPLIINSTLEANLFDLEPPVLPAVTATGVNDTTLKAWVYGRTLGDEGYMWFNGSPLIIDSATYQWFETEFEQPTEDLGEPNHGLPGGSWPTVSITGATHAGDTHVAAISIIRTTVPL